MTDLVTLAQAQAFVQDSTSASQPWVQACLDAASQAVMDFIGCDPTTQTRTVTMSGANTNMLMPHASGLASPISGVTSITVNPALSAPGNQYWGLGIAPPTPTIINVAYVQFTDGEIFLANGQKFPRGNKNITLVYTSGYALTTTAGLQTLPNSIVQAVLYTTKAFFTAMGKELNATSESYSGVLSQGFGPNGPGALPMAAQQLLNRYQIKWVSPG